MQQIMDSKVYIEPATQEVMTTFAQVYKGKVVSEGTTHQVEVMVYVGDNGTIYITLEDAPDKEEEEELLDISRAEIERIMALAAVEDIA